jgi:3-oxoacyl-[acyl-carrier protein] reductase
MNSGDFEGRVAVVTGGVEGIGWASAAALARRGAFVHIVGRVDDERLSERVDALMADGLSCAGHVSDVRDAASVKALYQSIFNQHRRLDILVANAGVLGDAMVGMISEELISSTLAINIEGVIRHLQGAARLMQRSGGGAVCLVSSIIALAGNPGQVVYGASKAAVIGAMRSAAKELAASNVRVNAVSPGFIATRMTSHLDRGVVAERLCGVPMGRIGTAEEVADVITFLVSDAARYVTGQNLGVDGGMVI